MAQIINENRQIIATSLGSANFNFRYQLGVIVKQIIVEATTNSTTFDIQILDPNNDVILERDSIVGTLNEFVEMPIIGSYTLEVLNASRDENFKVKIIAYEKNG